MEFGKLIWSVFKNLLLKGISIPAGFFLTVLLANGLGVEDFGRYSLIVSGTALVCAGFNRLFNVLLPVEIPSVVVLQETRKVLGLIVFCTISAAIPPAVIAIVLDMWDDIPVSVPDHFEVLVFLSMLIVLIGSALRGLKSIVLGVAVEQTFRVLIQLMFVLIVVYIFKDESFGFSKAIDILVYSSGAAVLLGLFFLIWRLYRDNYLCFPSYDHKWLKYRLPALISLGYIGGANSQMPVLLTGALSFSGEVADFRVAIALSGLISVALFSINMVVAPRLSTLATLGEYESMEDLLRIASTMALYLAIPLAIVFTVFGDDVIRSLFNPDYASVSEILWICCLAQVVNSFCGPVVLAFNVLKKEKFNLYALIVATLVGLLAGVVFIPSYGATGTALSYLLSVIAWNVYLVLALKNRYGMRSLPYWNIVALFQQRMNG